MRAKCKRCGDIVEVTRPREFKSCKCGAINLDYGDEFYYRVGGNPEDFDGEIEGAPKIHNGDIVIEHFHPEQTETTIKYDDSMERAMDIIGEENIGGESKPMREAAEAHECLSKAIKVKESYMNVNVDLCEDGTLWIDDAETDEQLAKFIIK